MKKTRVVTFSNRGARILINPAVIPEGSLVNPNLSQVEHVSPEFWKLDNSHIVEMSDSEKQSVEKTISFSFKKPRNYTVPISILNLLLQLFLVYRILR